MGKYADSFKRTSAQGSDRRFYVNTTPTRTDSAIIIDVIAERGSQAVSLSAKDAYELIAWIQKNVVPPVEKTARQLFDELPIDGLFSWGEGAERSVYRKSSSDTFYLVKGARDDFTGTQFKRHHVSDVVSKLYSFEGVEL